MKYEKKKKPTKAFLARLNALAKKKTEESYKDAKRLYRERHDKWNRLGRHSVHGLWNGIQALIQTLNSDYRFKSISLPAETWFANDHSSIDSPERIREELILLLQYTPTFISYEYEIAENVDMSKSDDENLHCQMGEVLFCVDFEIPSEWMLKEFRVLVQTFARLAHNIRSPFLSEIISCSQTVDLQSNQDGFYSFELNEATKWVDDFIRHWKALMTEVNLMKPEERLANEPEVAELEGNEYDPDDFDTREAAEDRHTQKNLALMPRDKNDYHPMRRLFDAINNEADTIKKGGAPDTKGNSLFDCGLLKMVLAGDFLLHYKHFVDESNFGKDTDTYPDQKIGDVYYIDKPTFEWKLKVAIVRKLCEYLNVARKASYKIRSTAYEDFCTCLAQLNPRVEDWSKSGYFKGLDWERSGKDPQVCVDLKRFVECLRNARMKLARDCQYEPLPRAQDKCLENLQEQGKEHQAIMEEVLTIGLQTRATGKAIKRCLPTGDRRNNVRTKSKQDIVNAIIDRRSELLNKGMSERHCLTEACNQIDSERKVIERGLYRSIESLRNAADRELKKM